MVEIRVYGMPGPQGSKRFVGHAKSGRGILIESSAKVKVWRECVKIAAIEVMDKHFDHARQSWCIPGPVAAEMIFTLPKPTSAPKKRRTWADRKPDLSKLVRSTEDALTSAGVYEDDARIVQLYVSKVYPNEGADALPIPGAVIRIRRVTDLPLIQQLQEK